MDKVAVIPLLIGLLAGGGGVGCLSCTDVTATPAVGADGQLGQCYVLHQDLPLVRAEYARHPMLLGASERERPNSSESPAGTLPAGTRIKVVAVERCGRLGFVQDFTVARVENGRLAGTRVITNRAGIISSAARPDGLTACPPPDAARP